MYDAKHRFIKVTDLKTKVVRQGQKGWWEKLLCADCESRLNRYEKHVRRMFTDPLTPPLFEGRTYEFPNVEYKLLKLFLLSVLWRASVSSLDECQHVKLGPHEERMRQMILADDLVDPDTYGCIVWVLFDGDRRFDDMMTEPTYHKHEGLKCYRFVMRGFVFMIYVASHQVPDATSRLYIGKQSAVRGYHANWDIFPFLRHAIASSAAIP